MRRSITVPGRTWFDRFSHWDSVRVPPQVRGGGIHNAARFCDRTLRSCSGSACQGLIERFSPYADCPRVSMSCAWSVSVATWMRALSASSHRTIQRHSLRIVLQLNMEVKRHLAAEELLAQVGPQIVRGVEVIVDRESTVDRNQFVFGEATLTEGMRQDAPVGGRGKAWDNLCHILEDLIRDGMHRKIRPYPPPTTPECVNSHMSFAVSTKSTSWL